MIEFWDSVLRYIVGGVFGVFILAWVFEEYITKLENEE